MFIDYCISSVNKDIVSSAICYIDAISIPQWRQQQKYIVSLYYIVLLDPFNDMKGSRSCAHDSSFAPKQQWKERERARELISTACPGPTDHVD